MHILLKLFIEFFQIGLFAIGGGPATLPFLMDLTEKYDWFTMEDLTNMIAISESTPGPIGINMATYAGFHAAGFPGGIVSTLSLVLPSVIIIFLIAKFLDNFEKNKTVKAVFYGVRPAVTGLIAAAVLGLMQAALYVETPEGSRLSIPLVILGIIMFGLMNSKKMKNLHPVIWIMAGAMAGIVFQL